MMTSMIDLDGRLEESQSDEDPHQDGDHQVDVDRLFLTLDTKSPLPLRDDLRPS